MEYTSFLERKHVRHGIFGFTVEDAELSAALFDFQRYIVKWAIRKGRAAVFAECGLGKTLMQLQCGDCCATKSLLPSLIVAPLAVVDQTCLEAKRFGFDVGKWAGTPVFPITIVNYDRVDEIDPSDFGCVVLDESSVLKNYSGKTKGLLCEMFAETTYRFAFTATPAPNDVIELGNHSEFLGVMPPNEIMMRWFINDTMRSGGYRLKGHAAKDFWRWVASWAVCVADPSDIGFDASRFVLPDLNLLPTLMPDGDPNPVDAVLFEHGYANATNYNRKLRKNQAVRIEMASKLVNASDGQWIVWVHHNAEAEAMERAIPGSVNVFGSMAPERKAQLLNAFANSEFRVLVTKQKIAGLGMNFQNCHHQLFTALDFSFEQFYQAVRRSWRFGQTQAVNIHYFTLNSMQNVETILTEKQAAFEEMREEMREAMQYNYIEEMALASLGRQEFRAESGNDWEMRLGDCVQLMNGIPDHSIDFSVFSPPFSNLYTYSSDEADMGNCKDDDEFFRHFGFLAAELHRTLRPGRLVAVHCKNLVNYINRDGQSGMRDFRGGIIQLFTSLGFSYHSEVTIWKDPVIEMQRTKAHGLLYKQLRADASFSRQGMAEYLLVFRKWATPETEAHIKPIDWKTKENWPLDKWQRYASPVWMDIRQTHVLNVQAARDRHDEKHICPLQIDVIERAVEMWTNPGDTILSPFAGIGSEGVVSVGLGRKFLGFELKESYFRQAAKNLRNAEASKNQQSLFETTPQ